MLISVIDGYYTVSYLAINAISGIMPVDYRLKVRRETKKKPIRQGGDVDQIERLTKAIFSRKTQ